MIGAQIQENQSDTMAMVIRQRSLRERRRASMQRSLLDEAAEDTLAEVNYTEQELTSNESMNTDQNGIKLFGALFLFRLCNSIFLTTWFDPDETWQSLEVAHNMVFGVGALTWEWKVGIRGACHPIIFAGIYKFIQILGLEHSILLIYAPRALQAVFAGLTDLYCYYMALRMFGKESAELTLACMLLSWFNFYCLVRTYSNSMEASMTMIALYYWPSQREPPATRQLSFPNNRDLRISLTFAAIGCILRPTNAIIWLFLGIKLLISYPHRVKPIAWDVFVTGVVSLGTSFSMDVFYYKRWIFTSFEFFKVNVVENISSFYGTHPFHWYFTQAIPLVLYTSLPFCVVGVMGTKNIHNLQPFLMCLVVALILSLQGHKEFRFLLPLLAPMQLYAGRGLHLIQKADLKACRVGIRAYFSLSISFLFFTNVLLALYFSRFHKRGIIDVMHYLRMKAYEGSVTSILFLMPCHSTPFYSHIHLPIPMRYIPCEPPLKVPEAKRPTYIDETDLLYQHPKEFIYKFFPAKIGNKTLNSGYSAKLDFDQVGYPIMEYSWPSHLVWYDNPKLGPVLKSILLGSNYVEVSVR